MERECHLAVDSCRAEDGGAVFSSFRAETKVRYARSKENDVPRYYIYNGVLRKLKIKR